MTATPNQTTMRCRGCGQPLPSDVDVHWDLESRCFQTPVGATTMTRRQAGFLDVLFQNRKLGAISSRERFLQAVYGDEINGGPSSYSIVAVHLHNIREKIKPLGWTITKDHSGNNFGHRLVRL